MARSTLKKHLAVWKQFVRYLLLHGQSCFPDNLGVVLQFVEDQSKGGAPRTWFKDFGRTLKFVEVSGEQDEDQLLHAKPALTNALKEASLKAAAVVTAKGKGRQALQLLVALIAAVEELIMDVRVLKFIRFYGWTRLVRHWSAMRWDDTMGLKPASLEMRPRGMVGQLERTKT